MSHDDDYLTAAVPEPLTEASPSERAHAKTFADIVDKALVGKAPVAMSADDRALLEVATVIRATAGRAELSAERSRSIVDDVLRGAIGEKPAARTVTPLPGPRAWGPWFVAGASTLVAAAAVVALWLRGPVQPTSVTQTAAPVDVAAAPSTWMSRSADGLVGPIARDKSGAAAERIDYLFADRLDGFRERSLSFGGGQ
jgi:hypothetical protein